MTITALPAQAAFHQWSITEIYSNSSGTLQFIEMFSPSINNEFTAGQHITVASGSNGAGTQQTFNLMSNTPAPTDNKFLLFATAGAQAAGAPAPNFIIPNGFLFQAGGSISYFGQGGTYQFFNYSALPTDGTMSRNWANGSNFAVNSPTNYAGQTGVITVPEPTSLALAPLAAGMAWIIRRRKAKQT